MKKSKMATTKFTHEEQLAMSASDPVIRTRQLNSSRQAADCEVVTRYPNFDWLRHFLALEVLLWHIDTVAVKFPFTLVIPPVPGFLAISGYLVLHSWDHSRSAGHFWWKRFLRIIPAMTASFILVWVLFDFESVVASLKLYLSLGFINTGQMSNGPLWSLGWEEVMYATIPALSLLGAYHRRAWILWCALGAALVYLFASSDLPRGIALSGSQLPAAFVLGNLAYVYKNSIAPFACRFGYYIAGFAITLRLIEHGLDGFIVPGQRIPENSLIWLLLIVAVLLIGLARQSARSLKMDISYGIYIYHWPIMRSLVDIGLTSIFLFPICISLTIAAAFLSWFVIEKPSLSLKNQLDWGALSGNGTTAAALKSP
jgi:peptidoglycan/LPS O-acetylase OafA/YrhL